MRFVLARFAVFSRSRDVEMLPRTSVALSTDPVHRSFSVWGRRMTCEKWDLTVVRHRSPSVRLSGIDFEQIRHSKHVKCNPLRWQRRLVEEPVSRTDAATQLAASGFLTPRCPSRGRADHLTSLGTAAHTCNHAAPAPPSRACGHRALRRLASGGDVGTRSVPLQLLFDSEHHHQVRRIASGPCIPLPANTHPLPGTRRPT